MGRTILVTGASGALGPHLLAELLRDEGTDQVCALMRPGPGAARRARAVRATVRDLALGDDTRRGDPVQRLHLVVGDVRRDDVGLEQRERAHLERHVDTVIHAAATTRFTAPLSDLREVNVEGTRRVLQLARACRRLEQFVLVSTCCVAGTRTGRIPERLERTEGAFVNPYERTKWEAEQVVAAAGLPSRIARLSTCLGAASTGYVHRFGAIHQAIRWLTRGLVPMLPGVEGAHVDLMATDVAARWLARAVDRPVLDLDVCQVAAGHAAIPIGTLVDVAVAHLCETAAGWAGGQIEAPVIVDTTTFDLFAQSVAASGDVLFGRVLQSARSFVPLLLYPKVYDIARAEELWGGPLPHSDWRSTLRHVIDFGSACGWSRARRAGGRVHV